MTDNEREKIFWQVIDNVIESGKCRKNSHEAGHAHNIALYALEVAAPELKKMIGAALAQPVAAVGDEDKSDA
jgi:hypothetical protein